MTQSPESIRLDKWLWYARFFKTRGLATKLVQAGKVRVDGVLVSKPSRTIGVGAVLTFPQGNRVRVAKVRALGVRRGPAPEAQTLYEDLTPPDDAPKRDGAHTEKGRPNRRDREKRIAFLREIGSSPVADDPSLD